MGESFLYVNIKNRLKYTLNIAWIKWSRFLMNYSTWNYSENKIMWSVGYEIAGKSNQKNKWKKGKGLAVDIENII